MPLCSSDNCSGIRETLASEFRELKSRELDRKPLTPSPEARSPNGGFETLDLKFCELKSRELDLKPPDPEP